MDSLCNYPENNNVTAKNVCKDVNKMEEKSDCNSNDQETFLTINNEQNSASFAESTTNSLNVCQSLQEYCIQNECTCFNIQLVCNSFLRSIENNNAINVGHYLQAYEELIKFFTVFGTLFTFVTKDAQSKINILKAYVNDKKDGMHYQTVQMMIKFETDKNLLNDQSRPSGSRTLLRLHRALEFISTFLQDVTKLNDTDSTVNSARNSYNQTLAKHHPWYIRKSVTIATIALPYRKNLIERVYGGRYPSGVNDDMAHLARITELVYKNTQNLYQEHDLLNLP